MVDEQDDDEPLSLGNEALAALQSVLGIHHGGVSFVEEMIASRRLAYEDEEEDDSHAQPENKTSDTELLSNDEDTIRPGETHADYYRRLYPERYKVNAHVSTKKVPYPVAVITIDDEYVRQIVLNAFESRPKWRVLTNIPDSSSTDHDSENSHYHFHWGEYEHIDWFSQQFQSEEVIVSCYYNRKGLIRKGHLARILENWRAKYKGVRKPLAPKSYVIRLPLSFGSDHIHHSDAKLYDHVDCVNENFTWTEESLSVLDKAIHDSGFPGFDCEDMDDIINESNEKGVWILKPSVTNQAKGIALVCSTAQLHRALFFADPIQQAGDFVLQKYIQPLLLDGRKFHLRVFMILHGNLTAYVAPDFLAIFSLQKYDGACLKDTRAHLTNIAHQEVLSQEDQERCMRRFEETKQDMVDAGLARSMDEATRKIEDVRTRVYNIIAETVEAVSSELTLSAKNNCFEIFGLDFLIDSNWNTWLLEANAEPDLSKAGDRLQHVIDKMILDCLSVVIDSDVRFQGDLVDHESSLVKVYERKGRSY